MPTERRKWYYNKGCKTSRFFDVPYPKGLWTSTYHHLHAMEICAQLRSMLFCFRGNYCKVWVFNSWDNPNFNKNPIGRDGISAKNVWEAGLWLLKWKQCEIIDRQFKRSLVRRHETHLDQWWSIHPEMWLTCCRYEVMAVTLSAL